MCKATGQSHKFWRLVGWFYFISLFMLLLLSFVFSFSFFLFVCLICVSCHCWPVCWCVLSRLCCSCHCFGLFLFLRAGTGCSYNHLLVSKLMFPFWNCNFSYWFFVLMPVCVLAYMYVYQFVVTCSPVNLKCGRKFDCN